MNVRGRHIECKKIKKYEKIELKMRKKIKKK
jgi:hypothetical protein